MAVLHPLADGFRSFAVYASDKLCAVCECHVRFVAVGRQAAERFDLLKEKLKRLKNFPPSRKIVNNRSIDKLNNALALISKFEPGILIMNGHLRNGTASTENELLF